MMPIRPDRSDLGTGACKLRARGTCAICFHTDKAPVRCVTFTLKIWVPGSAVMLLVYLHKKSKSPILVNIMVLMVHLPPGRVTVLLVVSTDVLIHLYKE